MKHWTLWQWITLLALSFSVFMISLDVTVVTVALPEIQRHLGLSMERLQWVVSAYSLSFGSLLMAGGTLADRFGRCRVFSIGLAVFAAASVACGETDSGAVLTVARVVQGVGAAFMSSSSAALVAGAFQGRDRPIAYGVWGAALGLGLAFGPALGGLITQHLSWHWIFLANAPVAILVLPTVLATVEETRDPDAHDVDLGGMASFSAGLGMLIYGLTAGPHLGWGSAAEAGLLAGSLLFFAVFVMIERRHAYPLFDLRLFALPTFVGVSIVPIAASIGYWSLFIYLPLYLDRAFGMSAIAIGVTMLPFTLPMLVMPPVAARLARVLAARHQFAAGLLLIAAGDCLLARAIGSGQPFGVPLLAAGLGAGLINAQITSVAVSVVPVARAGMASGISATMRQVGYGLGIAGLGAVLNIVSQQGLNDALKTTPGMQGVDAGIAFAAFEGGAAMPDPHRRQLSDLLLAAFTHGMETMLLVAGALTLAGALAAWLLVRGGGVQHTAGAAPVVPSD
jgi:EmrB/QacA subfamily drug resistance transporter